MIIAIPYLLLFVFYLYWSFLFRNQYASIIEINPQKIYYTDIVVIIIYLIFYGLRGFIFTDCFQYYDLFTDLYKTSSEVDYVNFTFEPGYIFCNMIIHTFTEDFFVFQFIWTLLDVVLLTKILKRETPECFLLAFALLIPFFDGIQMNLFRNIKGILIAFYAFRYIYERNFKKYLFFIIIATSIHISSIIFFPLYFFVGKNLRKLFVLLCATSIVLYFSNLDFFNELFFVIGLYTGEGKIDKVMNSYIESQNGGGFTLGFVFRLLMMLALLYKYETLSKKNVIVLNVALLYLISCTAFNSILVMRDRFGQLFALAMPCILPYVFSSIEQLQRKRNFIIVVLLFLLGQVYVQHNNLAAQYENVLTGVSDRNNAQIRITEAALEYSGE